jgi:N,N-dimethylformamidase
MSFKFVTSDNQGNFYAVTANGELLYYRDEARDGASQWAFGGTGQRIGSGWNDFLHVFSGGDGIIYAIRTNGDLLYFRDEARDGTSQWAFGGIGQKISSGWNSFVQVFSGGDGIIYALASNGDLLYFRDEARDGTSQWAFGGTGQKIKARMKDFLHAISGGNGVIYAVDEEGDLLLYLDKAQDGTRDWAFGGRGRKIASGWNSLVEICYGGDGIIYAITADGFLLYFRDEARNGNAEWANSGQGQSIGAGWFLTGQQATDPAGYCVPLSAFPGATMKFKVSARHDYKVTYLRLKQQSDGAVGIPMTDTFDLKANTQISLPEPWKDGCGWRTSFTLEIPAIWPSGLYGARCAYANGDESYIVFILKPEMGQRGDFAAIASTNTWSAYNDWGDQSKYSAPPASRLSFERPAPPASPVDDGRSNHLTRSELWILNWLEDEGYNVDVYSDFDFHLGIEEVAGYKALILGTHPEYWSLQMVDNLKSYLENGGSLLYLGGNGLFERVDFSDDGKTLILMNDDPKSQREASYLRNLTPARPEREVLGVAYRFDNYQTFAPYEVMRAGHDLFAGTGLADGDLIGEAGINGGAASGWEMDTSEAGNAPAGKIVSATGADDRGNPPDNLELLARGTNPGYGADMIYYETGAGGFVFSVGSLSFGGSLIGDIQLQAIVKNALNKSLGQ